MFFLIIANLRIATQLVGFKRYFSKVSPYMISEYICRANAIPIHPEVKVKIRKLNI